MALLKINKWYYIKVLGKYACHDCEVSVLDTLNSVKCKCFTVGNTKRLAIDALDSTQGISVLKVNAEEKPWRKAGK